MFNQRKGVTKDATGDTNRVVSTEQARDGTKVSQVASLDIGEVYLKKIGTMGRTLS
jgi:hypothetical protein